MLSRVAFPVLASAAMLTQYASATTVYTAGDSTMALGGGGNGTQGWAEYLGQYLTIDVVNKALAGTSARSYTYKGLFQNIINTVQKGDYVIIEFGHNDGESGATDNGREDAYGSAYSSIATVTESNGTTDVIHTYVYYIQNAVTALQSKGAIPIVSAQTPDNIWPLTIGDGPRFVGYAQDVASATGVTYVDHYDYVVQAYNAIGETTVDTYYPIDHTHTSPTGANVVAEAFVRGLLCGSSSLKSYVNTAGKDVPNGCL